MAASEKARRRPALGRVHHRRVGTRRDLDRDAAADGDDDDQRVLAPPLGSNEEPRAETDWVTPMYLLHVPDDPADEARLRTDLVKLVAAHASPR